MIFCEYTHKRFPDSPKRVYISPDKFLIALKGHKKGDITLKSVEINNVRIDVDSILETLIL